MKSLEWTCRSSNFPLLWIAHLVFEMRLCFPDDAALRTQKRLLEVLKIFILFRLKGSTSAPRFLPSGVEGLRPYPVSSLSVSKNSSLIRLRHFVITSTLVGSRRSGARSESSILRMPTALPQISRRVFLMSNLTRRIFRSSARLWAALK